MLIKDYSKEMLDESNFNKNTGLEEIKPKRGKITNRRFYPVPDIDRESYCLARNIENRNTLYSDFKEYKNERLIHLSRINTVNFYPKDMRDVLDLFFKYYTDENLYVINGFRSAKEIGVNVHSIGLAVDIVAKDKLQAKQIANAAYATGLANIVYGGNYNTGNGYVHIDIAPNENFIYKAGFYEGPWS